MTEEMQHLTSLSPSALPALVRWITPDGTTKSEWALPALLGAKIHLARTIRTGNRYPRQRNYHGKYYFSQTGHHVWHESLLEASVLTWIDMRCDIQAIASQPMTIEFADGSIHTPDFFALHGNDSEVLYDVKPTKYMTAKAVRQFEKTREVCDSVGWTYEVHNEFTDQVRVNLEWFAAFKHPGFHPGNFAVQLLLAELDRPMSVREAARALQLGSLPEARAAIYHLVWTQVLTTNLNQPIRDETIVERNHNVHA